MFDMEMMRILYVKGMSVMIHSVLKLMPSKNIYIYLYSLLSMTLSGSRFVLKHFSVKSLSIKLIPLTYENGAYPMRLTMHESSVSRVGFMCMKVVHIRLYSNPTVE